MASCAGLSRVASTPAQLSGAGPKTPPANGEVQRKDSAEGWRWFSPSESPSGSPESSWSSGFPRPSHTRDPESLGPVELFKWLAEVLRLSEEDVDSLGPCRELSHVSMAEQVYSRLLEYRGIRAHLRVSTSEQIAQRKQMIERYLAWCTNLKRGSAESYVAYLDHVASVHQRRPNHVPPTLLLVGMAITQDTLLRHLCVCIDDKVKLQRSASAVSKLMWMQAVFFVKHAHKAERMRAPSFWRCLLALWVLLACSRGLAPGSGRGRGRVALVDLTVAAAGALLMPRLVGWL